MQVVHRAEWRASLTGGCGVPLRCHSRRLFVVTASWKADAYANYQSVKLRELHEQSPDTKRGVNLKTTGAAWGQLSDEEKEQYATKPGEPPSSGRRLRAEPPPGTDGKPDGAGDPAAAWKRAAWKEFVDVEYKPLKQKLQKDKSGQLTDVEGELRRAWCGMSDVGKVTYHALYLHNVYREVKRQMVSTYMPVHGPESKEKEGLYIVPRDVQLVDKNGSVTRGWDPVALKACVGAIAARLGPRLLRANCFLSGLLNIQKIEGDVLRNLASGNEFYPKLTDSGKEKRRAAGLLQRETWPEHDQSGRPLKEYTSEQQAALDEYAKARPDL